MREAWKSLMVAAVLALTPAPPVGAQGYDTTTLVNSNNNECRGIPECRSIPMPAVGVPARGRISTRFVCPESHPHFWAWDVRLHEHIAAELIKSDRKGPTIEATNQADVEGHVLVYLGCSTIRYDGNSVLAVRRLAPTGWIGQGVRKPNAIHRPE